jgi:hypothetical protein
MSVEGFATPDFTLETDSAIASPPRASAGDRARGFLCTWQAGARAGN